MLHEPIQVKQSEGIGRNVVDNFETAVKRSGKANGQIVAFSFGKGAHEEAARAKADGLDIALVTVADLLKGNLDLVTPEGGLFGAELPLPTPRDEASIPTVEELIGSDESQAAYYRNVTLLPLRVRARGLHWLNGRSKPPGWPGAKIARWQSPRRPAHTLRRKRRGP